MLIPEAIEGHRSGGGAAIGPGLPAAQDEETVTS